MSVETKQVNTLADINSPQNQRIDVVEAEKEGRKYTVFYHPNGSYQIIGKRSQPLFDGNNNALYYIDPNQWMEQPLRAPQDLGQRTIEILNTNELSNHLPTIHDNRISTSKQIKNGIKNLPKAPLIVLACIILGIASYRLSTQYYGSLDKNAPVDDKNAPEDNKDALPYYNAYRPYYDYCSKNYDLNRCTPFFEYCNQNSDPRCQEYHNNFKDKVN